MLISNFVVSIFLIGMIVPSAGTVSAAVPAEEYPNKPIRMVTSAIGGSNDFTARILAQGLSASFGQQVIVDNRATVFQGTWLPNAPRDGYNLLLGGEPIWQLPLLQKMPYDAMRDFNPIVLVGNVFNVLVVHPSVPVKSVKELVDLAKAKPGELNYGSAHAGSSAHLAGALFESLAGVKLMWIPHKGTGEMVNNLVGGQGVHLAFVSVPSVAHHFKSGRLRAVAVTSTKPSALVPGLPTVAETVPGYTAGGQLALFAPPGTPAAIVNRLNREAVRFLSTAETKERFGNAGIEVAASSPEELSAFMKSEIVKWSKVIKDAGIKLE